MTRRADSGFTLIELLLALAFVGFVLLFAISTIVQVMRTYNKGLAVKEINQVSRTVLDDMARVTRTATPGAINSTAISSGRLCLGSVSYVWNIRNASVNRYSGPGNPRVTFARVDDPGAVMCNNASGSYPNVDPARSSSLLSDRIWVQDVTVAVNMTTSLVDLSLRLSTADTATDPAITYPGGVATCTGAVQGQFCAVAVFNTTVAATGGY